MIHPTRRQFLETLAVVVASGGLASCNDRGGADAPPRSASPGLSPGPSPGLSPELPPELRARGEQVLARGASALWSRQAASGVFASATYGVFRAGQSLTPFALECLLRMPARFDPSEVDRRVRVRSALSALLALRSDVGALGFASSIADYPCYATALFVSCLGLARPDGWRDVAAPSIAWLREQQFRRDAGWAGHPAEGGWGMGSERPRTPPDAGHVDASMTRRVLESLRAADVASSDPVFAEALAFVDRCQTSNGASLYSPVELALNKGQRSADDETLGYGSATADSLLARAAAGAPSDTRARQALAWLEAHHTPTENPGVSGGPMEPFASAMRGYYRAGAARCFRAFGGPKRWRGELIEAIAAEQGSDGSWQNESSLQKEDEPIIATAFAVDALTSCLFVGSS